MTAFKKHLTQSNSRHLLNAVSLYVDIEKYCHIDSSPQSQKKKQEQAALIPRSVRVVLQCSDTVGWVTGRTVHRLWDVRYTAIHSWVGTIGIPVEGGWREGGNEFHCVQRVFLYYIRLRRVMSAHLLLLLTKTCLLRGELKMQDL